MEFWAYLKISDFLLTTSGKEELSRVIWGVLKYI